MHRFMFVVQVLVMLIYTGETTSYTNWTLEIRQ